MTARIDLDIILYRCLFACKDQNFYSQVRACDSTINNILDFLGPKDFELVMTGPNNFRYKIDPTYKANRKPEGRPKYLYDAKKYFLSFWSQSVLTNGIEADDHIATTYKKGDVIVSTDKDFLQTGGTIFNWTKWNYVELDQDPLYYFFCQVLTGDTADNIKGIRGLGEVKAARYLQNKNNEERLEIVKALYQDHFGDDWFTKFDTNCRLLWLRRKENDEYYNHIK